MKTLVFLSIFILLLAFTAKTQIRLIAHDAKGLTDTAVFGFKHDATVGIDEAYGEKNIYGQPYKELDMRFIQRTANITINDENYWEYDSCHSQISPFSENIDTKIDLREEVNTIDVRNFILAIKATNYPVYVICEILGSIGGVVIPFHSYNRECKPDSQDLYELTHFLWRNDTIGNYKQKEFEFKFISFEPQLFVNVNTIELSYNIYPVPFKNEVIIECEENNLHFSLFDTSGRKLCEKYLINGKNIITTQNLPKGVYFIELYNNKNRVYKKVIKE